MWLSYDDISRCSSAMSTPGHAYGQSPAGSLYRPRSLTVRDLRFAEGRSGGVRDRRRKATRSSRAESPSALAQQTARRPKQHPILRRPLDRPEQDQGWALQVGVSPRGCNVNTAPSALEAGYERWTFFVLKFGPVIPGNNILWLRLRVFFPFPPGQLVDGPKAVQRCGTGQCESRLQQLRGEMNRRGKRRIPESEKV